MVELKDQLALEGELREMGRVKYQQAQHLLAKAGLNSITDWGTRLIASICLPFAEEIKKFLEVANGRAGRRHVVAEMLEQLPLDLLALSAARTIINGTCRPGPTAPNSASISVLVADAVLTEMQAIDLHREQAKLYRSTLDQMKRHPRGKELAFRTSVLRNAAKKFGVTVTAWSLKQKAAVGRSLIEMFAVATGLIDIRTERQGKKTFHRVHPSEQLLKWVTNWRERAELLCPVYLPTIIPPRRWDNTSSGGYYSFSPRYDGLVKTRTKGYKVDLASAPLSKVLTAVNRLQETPWRVNGWLLDQVKQAEKLGLSVADTLVGDPTPVPPRPDVDREHPKYKAWKAEAADIFRANRSMVGRKIAQARTLYVADKFRPYDRFYFPYPPATSH